MFSRSVLDTNRDKARTITWPSCWPSSIMVIVLTVFLVLTLHHKQHLQFSIMVIVLTVLLVLTLHHKKHLQFQRLWVEQVIQQRFTHWVKLLLMSNGSTTVSSKLIHAAGQCPRTVSEENREECRFIQPVSEREVQTRTQSRIYNHTIMTAG